MQAAIVSSVKYFLIALLLLIFGFLFLVQSVHAQSECVYDQTATDKEIIDQVNRCIIENDNYDDKAFSKNQFFGLIDAANTSILGISQLNPEISGITANRSALASVSTMIAGLYANPPTSGKEYFAQQIQKFNPIQPAYAQTGKGYDSLKPVQQLWTVFRNASYVGFVIVFVIIGFMIMFRAHISPQAVATVQDSIPRIVIALILVTFSYAIAGFMIDIMFVAINIVIQLFAQSGVIKAETAQSTIFDKNIIGVITNAWDDIFGITAQAINNLLKSINFAGPLTGLLSFTISGIGALIVGIAALFIMFRILFMLLMAYVMIILLTLVAPFFFLIQSLPGNNGAREWFKQMASNVAVFPAVSLMILFAGVIGGVEAFGGGEAGRLAQEAGTEALKFPLLAGGLNPKEISRLIAIGILFMTPEVANLIKNSMGAKGPGFGGAGAAALGAAGGFLGNRAAQSRYGRAFSDIMEERGRAGSQRLLTRLGGTTPPPPGAPAGTPATPNIPARGKLPH